MISSTSTKNISPRGTQRMAAPSVTAAITVRASRTPSTATDACEADQAMATAIVTTRPVPATIWLSTLRFAGSLWP